MTQRSTKSKHDVQRRKQQKSKPMPTTHESKLKDTSIKRSSYHSFYSVSNWSSRRWAEVKHKTVCATHANHTNRHHIWNLYATGNYIRTPYALFELFSQLFDTFILHILHLNSLCCIWAHYRFWHSTLHICYCSWSYLCLDWWLFRSG